MVDDVDITPGTGKTVKSEDIGGKQYQWIIPAWGPTGTANKVDVAAGKPFPVQLRGSDGNEIVAGIQITISVDITRAANTTTYGINENFGSTPAGGYTITGAGRVSGGSGFIHDMAVVFAEDAATPLQGEIDIYDTAITAVADNAALVVSDAEAKTYVGTIPFVLTDAGDNAKANVLGQNLAFTCVGGADLRFVVRSKNAYAPTTNSSVLTVRFKISQTT